MSRKQNLPLSNDCCMAAAQQRLLHGCRSAADGAANEDQRQLVLFWRIIYDSHLRALAGRRGRPACQAGVGARGAPPPAADPSAQGSSLLR